VCQRGVTVLLRTRLAAAAIDEGLQVLLLLTCLVRRVLYRQVSWHGAYLIGVLLESVIDTHQCIVLIILIIWGLAVGEGGLVLSEVGILQRILIVSYFSKVRSRHGRDVELRCFGGGAE